MTDDAEKVANRFLIFVMLMGGVLRFLNLEAPPLRWDELVVPLTARYPVEYILDWCRRCEVHPPGFHLLVKAFMAGGDSDLILRLPAFGAGVLLIWLSFKLLKETLSSRAAIVGSVLVATDPFLILFSRQVRPYTIWLCLVALSCLLFCRLARESTRNDWLKLVAVNFLAYSTHFISVIVFPAQVVAYYLLDGKRLSSRKTWFFLLSVTLPFLAVTPFLLGMMRREPVSGSISYLEVAANTWSALNRAFFPFHDSTFIRLGIAALALLGLFRILRTNRPLFYYIASSSLFPVAVIIALRYGSYYNPWHLIFIPYFCILCLSSLLNDVRMWITCFVALLIGSANVFTLTQPLASKIFSNDYIYEGNFCKVDSNMKSLVSYFPKFLTPGTFVRSQFDTEYYSTSWYIDQICPYQNFTSNSLAPDRTGTTITTIASRPDIEDGTVVAELPPFRLVQKTIPRLTPQTLRLRETATVTNQPDSFFANVHELRDITVFSDRGYSVYPSRNGDTGFFSFVFKNDSLPATCALEIHPRFRNSLRGGTFSIEAQFDDDQPVPVLANKGLELPPKADFVLLEPKLYLRRYTPFSTLTVRFRFHVPLTTPGYPGGNLSLMSFFQLSVTPLGLGLDFFAPDNLDRELSVTGLRDLESDGPKRWRWATGPETSVTFSAPAEREARLRFGLLNIMPGQQVRIEVNGQALKTIGPIAPGKWLTPNAADELPFTAKAGRNTIKFIYRTWNSPGTPVLADPSPYSAAFTELSVE
ncbi:glycosyltransferase family 39 protein [Fundidesulfovibrio terrae]|uniref:glycosyltransferase family 39 protein n=1 Tax=Fundidesulfovibrio terrae TaxID=2922866 RepID=UPI001FAF43BE